MYDAPFILLENDFLKRAKTKGALRRRPIAPLSKKKSGPLGKDQRAKGKDSRF